MSTRAPESFAEQLSGVALGPAQQEIIYDFDTVDIHLAIPELGNKDLKIYKQKAELIEAMNSHQVVIVVAPTGTGKSTQLPQYALEAGFNKVTMTQPRRRAAQNVAERIQDELGEVLGAEAAAELVSYQHGGGLVGPYSSKIQVVTEGLLTARDAFHPTDGENEVWVLDERHEQTKHQFLLGGLAKQKLAENPNFTTVVMTATPSLEEEIDFWTNENGEEPAVVVLGGETMFEIDDREAPHSTEVKECVKAAIDIFKNPDAHDGSNVIQIFVPGKKEIQDVMDQVRARLPAEVLEKTKLLGNHAKMTPKAQAPVYEDFNGIKIVVQTNIGKTSMTIPRTRYVITAGIERQVEIDEEGAPALLETPSSQDCMMQMRGRCGRTSTGIFIQTKSEGRAFIPMAERPAHLPPEILRSEIDSIVLYLATRGRNIKDFEGAEIIPEVSIERAVRRNQALGALDDSEKITTLGKKMAKYPCGPEWARSLVEAEKHSQHIKLYMAAITAATEVGGLKLFEYDRTTNWEALSDETSSDSMAQLDTFIAVQGKKLREMDFLDVDVNNLILTEQMYRKIAHRMGVRDIPELPPPDEMQRNILRECIAAGFVNSVYLPYGEGLFKHVGEALKIREISNRSVVESSRNVIVGKPRNVQVYVKGKREMKNIIEEVTELPNEALRASALAKWIDYGFKLRGGKFKQVQQQLIGNRPLDSREVVAQPSPLLRAAVIEHVKTMPGPSLIKLYKIKKDLERLAHKAKYPGPRFTEDMINQYIEDATPNTATDPSLVEENLRQRIGEEELSLASFVSVEQQDKIHADAPMGMIVGGYTVKLNYSNGKATAKRFSLPMLNALGDELQLPDGRTVFFIHEDKRYTLLQLKRRLYDEGLL